jgi:hypothetical protein
LLCIVQSLAPPGLVATTLQPPTKKSIRTVEVSLLSRTQVGEMMRT